MRQVLQLLSLLLAVIAVAVGWRIMQVVRIEPPVFNDPEQVAAAGPAFAPVRRKNPNPAIITAVVDGNIFQEERGYTEKPGDGEPVDVPLPPPTNVLLSGIIVLGGEPIAILTDTKQGNAQKSLRMGEMVDVYEVGEIGDADVTLLGPGGQRFALALEISKGPARRATPLRPTPSRATPPRPTPTRATPPTRPGRPTPASRTPSNRATTPANNRAAQANRAAARPRPAPTRPQPQDNRADPAQARLEALKQLRAAAAGN